MDWIIFIFLAAAIIVAGSRLSFYADVLAIKFNISRSAIGALLVSVITSLPELTTTLGSILKVKSPDMAIGNVFGSNLFNLSIIAGCDIIFIKAGVFRHIHRREALPTTISLAIIALATAGLLIPLNIAMLGANFGLGSILVIGAYLAFFRWMHKTGQLEEIIGIAKEQTERRVSVKRAVVAFAICSLIIIACGISLAVVADRISKATGMTHSFMGILFLATATSLPELSVGISAVRRGSFDLLMGTVLGSNIFNILVLAIADLLYIDAALNIPLNLGWSHLITACGVMLATLFAILGIRYRPKKLPTTFNSMAIIGIYLFCLLAIYKDWL